MPAVESVTRTDAGLAAELRGSVMRLRRRLAHERHPDNDLSIGAMSVLGALFRRGDLAVGELAAFERVRPPSMTRTVSGLEAAGLVERRPHESDGRQVVVSLTATGRATVHADRTRRDEWLTRRLDDLTPAQRDVLRAAAPILDQLTRED